MDRREFAAEADRRRREGLVVNSPIAYERRHEIKAAGGIWDARERVWLVPDRATLQLLVLRARSQWAMVLEDPSRFHGVVARGRGAYERLVGVREPVGEPQPERDRALVLEIVTALEEDDQVLEEWCRLSGMPRQLVEAIRAAGDLGPLVERLAGGGGEAR